MSEHVLARGRSSVRQGGSILGSKFLTRQITLEDIETSSPSLERPRAPTSPVVSPTSENVVSFQPPSVNAKFHTFIKENFESCTLLEEHQVLICALWLISQCVYYCRELSLTNWKDKT